MTATATTTSATTAATDRRTGLRASWVRIVDRSGRVRVEMRWTNAAAEAASVAMSHAA